MAPIYHAKSDAISRKKHMCIVKTAAGGGFISVHNSQWASENCCSWSTHFEKKLNRLDFFKIITWKFIRWSQGKLLVFVTGQSRTSRGNTSCLIIFLVPTNIGEEHVTHTKATLMRFHWYFLFFLDRSAKVRLAGQEILKLHDFVLSVPSPATHLESSVYVSHCMIVS